MSASQQKVASVNTNGLLLLSSKTLFASYVQKQQAEATKQVGFPCN